MAFWHSNLYPSKNLPLLFIGGNKIVFFFSQKNVKFKEKFGKKERNKTSSSCIILDGFQDEHTTSVGYQKKNEMNT